ncbi:MAG TPA: hypothetical protein PKE69_00845 [Pyrinomonadaceae bacterium]|nr:hypothetical protein [Pyrinomonadaceae bacterium]
MNKTSFGYDNYTIGELIFDSKKVQSVGGFLYPQLVLPVELHLNQNNVDDSTLPRFTLISAVAELYVNGIPFKIADSITILSDLEFRKTYKNEYDFRFEFPLDALRLKAIEASRSGDLNLKLIMKFQLAIKKPLRGNESSAESFFLIERFRNKRHELHIEIPQSYWVKNILPNLGLGEFFIIEIPKGSKTLEDAWKYLEKAENSLRNWDSKGVFANCREIGTHLDSYLKKKFGKENFIYAERWGRAIQRFSHFASLELHLEDLASNSNKFTSDEIKTHKNDAEYIIFHTKLLIKYAESLINE